MKKWFETNYKTIIKFAFIIPIITVAIVSISHVTRWYGITNPISWAMYLSLGVEIAALSAIAAISANVGNKIYLPFGIVTLIQFLGNVFFSFSYIDINSQLFKDWVDMVAPITELIGIDSDDTIGNRRFLSFFTGGLLPLISLSFLHMLVKFNDNYLEPVMLLENTEETEIELPLEDVIKKRKPYKKRIKSVKKKPLNESVVENDESNINEPIISIIPPETQIKKKEQISELGESKRIVKNLGRGYQNNR